MVVCCQSFPVCPAFFHSGKANRLNMLVHITADSRFKHQDGDGGKAEKMYAPDAQFSGLLSPAVDCGSKIFEVAYSESYQHAREKAVEYLWSDRPRPCAGLFINFSKQKKD